MKTVVKNIFFSAFSLVLTLLCAQQASALASISGRLTDTSDNPIANGFVVLYTQAGAECGGTNTLADGTYTISSISPGSYKVFFLGTPAYVGKWYNNKPDMGSADLLDVSADQAVTGINAQLVDYSSLFGSISGLVTRAGGSALSGIKVQIYSPAAGQWSNKITTGINGAYTFSGIWPGDYKVIFWGVTGQYLQQWYNGKPDMATADTVQVTASHATTGINAQLADYDSTRVGSISGSVTDASYNPLQDMEVWLYDQTNQLWRDGVLYTDADGAYTFDSLWPGTYKVFFSGTAGEYYELWYHNKPDIDTPDPVEVTANHATTGIDALFGPASTTTTVGSTTTTIAISSSSTTTVEVSSSTTTTILAESTSSTTTSAPATTTTASSTTTTVQPQDSCLQIVPQKVIAGYWSQLHFFVFIGSQDTVFARGDRPVWNADFLRTLMKLRLNKRSMLALVYSNPLTAVAGTYEATIGDCSGTVTVARRGQ